MAGKFHNIMALFTAFLLLTSFLGCAPIIEVRMLEKRVKQLEIVALQKASDAHAKAQECCQLSTRNAEKAEAAAFKAQAADSKAEEAAISAQAAASRAVEAAARADSAAEILSIFLLEESGRAPK